MLLRTTTSQAQEDADEGDVPGEDVAPVPGMGEGEAEAGGIRARHRRRLQARNVAMATATDAAAAAVPEQPPTQDAQPQAQDDDVPPAPESSSDPLPPAAATAELLPTTAAFTTGGNTLRKRFQASRQQAGTKADETGAKDIQSDVGRSALQDSAKKTRVVPAPSLLQTLTSSEALVRFWLLCVAGVLSGAWIAGLNAAALAQHRDSATEAPQQQQPHDTRAALDDYMAKATDTAPTAGGGGGRRGGVWGWVRGLFLPDSFDSLPLPLLGLLWHAVVVATLLAMRPGTGVANGRARTASAFGDQQPLLDNPEGIAEGNSSGSSTGGGNKSIVETMAYSFGLGPLLEVFKRAQTAWQDVMVFTLFFLLTVALRA